MRQIGTVARLQIQRSSLKAGEKPNLRYDATPLLAVERLWLSPDGVLGLGPEGSWLVDVHHRAHPGTKNEDGLHGVSVGFTSHYRAMRDRFGNRITLGCAGENLIAETDQVFSLDDLREGLGVVDRDGRELVRISVLQVAHPCRPFTGWAAGQMVSPEELKAHLQFLDGGMRGFYCVGAGTGIVSVGDRLVIL